MTLTFEACREMKEGSRAFFFSNVARSLSFSVKIAGDFSAPSLFDNLVLYLL